MLKAPVHGEVPPCFVCGDENSGKCSLLLRHPNPQTPQFPFLDHHIPSLSYKACQPEGNVLSCYKCHSALMQQWDLYETKHVPITNRLYSGQSSGGKDTSRGNDIEQNVLGTETPYQATKSDRYVSNNLNYLNLSRMTTPITVTQLPIPKAEYQEEALDLTVDKRGKKRPQEQSESSISSCGDSDSSSLRDVSSPECLLSYVMCDLCEKQFQNGSIRTTLLDSLQLGDPLYLLLVKNYPKLGIQSTVPNLLQTCQTCCTVIESLIAYVCTKEDTSGIYKTMDNEPPPSSSGDLNQNQSKVLPVSSDVTIQPHLYSEKTKHSDIPGNMKKLSIQTHVNTLKDLSQCSYGKCSLCHKNIDSNQLYHVAVFPNERKLQEISQNNVKSISAPLNSKCISPACKRCYLRLKTTENVERYPNLDGQHFVQSPATTSDAAKAKPSPLYTAVWSQYDQDKVYEKEIKRSESIRNSSKIIDELETPEDGSRDLRLPSAIRQRPLNIKTPCYLCGANSKPGFTYALNSKQTNKNPYYFPFLSNFASSHPEAQLEQFYLLCTICFHSLVKQWYNWEKNKKDAVKRSYDIHNFTCYICSMVTYRKRTHLLRVKDYPFLKDHIPPAKGMVMKDGCFVNTCQDCSISLKDQYSDMEKYGVPVGKRQYNWIKKPPPPEADTVTGQSSIFTVYNQAKGNPKQQVVPLISSSLLPNLQTESREGSTSSTIMITDTLCKSKIDGLVTKVLMGKKEILSSEENVSARLKKHKKL